MPKEGVLMKDLNSIVVLPSEPMEPESRVASNKRFLVVLCVMLLYFSSTCQWIAYAPVGNYVNTIYGEGSSTWFSLIYMLVTIPMGFIGMWMGSSAGLRFAFYSAAFFNAFGAIIRSVSCLWSGHWYHFHMALLGQGISALAYPFIMFLPTTISADWFPREERTTATTVGVMSNPLGILVANFVVPLVVKSSEEIWMLDITLCGFSCVVALLIWAIVTENRPSSCANRPLKNQLSYVANLRKCLTNTNYLMLLFAIGGGIGMFNCLYTMMQELTCPAGYENHVAGYYAMFMILSGIVGAVVGGRMVDWYPQCCRGILFGSITAAVFFGLLFLQLTQVPGIPWILGIVGCFFGMAGLTVYPIGLQLATETVYPAASETASGLIVLMGQVFSVVFLANFKFFATAFDMRQFEFLEQKCMLNEKDERNMPKNYTVSILIVSVIACILPILMALIRPMESQRCSSSPQSRASNDVPFKMAEKTVLVRPC